ncbi:AAA family ATPase [Burkholderia pseudomallei]|uniref:AAA family ATPase n=1 Tax=Burkholderia pseudomallei TaxID=28450 RepID=UPI000F077CEA|nr:AAA family ATPase [Burkholderia pseudomallei]CAJ3075799.1 ATP-dependent endopeptidase Lon [Burkholderia pseudomallei]VCK72575.1 ATP-dependent endopeptidase Lon [Burkholderia pseudomallei]VCK79890.1 ATP-dependent endopeptidase Lon [Burkholderia pseudomallei]VCK80113.1 ATP-dependent endopeptidase Lon [Burkholderia pseudomallei]VCK80685.1 ATP-dependent endopeptidase Lon [Burkholderia pseudomallei]
MIFCPASPSDVAPTEQNDAAADPAACVLDASHLAVDLFECERPPIVAEPAASRRPAREPLERPMLDVFDIAFVSEMATAAYKPALARNASVARAAARWCPEIKALSGYRPAADLPRVEAIARLVNEFPNFKEWIDDVAATLSLAHAAEATGSAQFPKMPHVLLVGPSGIGKTHVAHELARAFAAEVHSLKLNETTPGFALCGQSPLYVEAAPGAVFELCARSRTANPILLLDELDKARFYGGHDILSPLLHLLEPDSAKTFTDEFWGLPFDASGICCIATANSISDIPAPLLSRFTIIAIGRPAPMQLRQIARKLYRAELRDRGLEKLFNPVLPSEVLDALGSRTPREIRRDLTRALAQCHAAGRNTLAPQDLAPLGASSAPSAIDRTYLH